MVKSLRKHFLALWKEKMNNCSDGKLQTYRYTKVKLASVVKNIWNWSFLSSFADGVGQVQCTRVSLDTKGSVNSEVQVEDEIHFLFNCSKYEPDRKELVDIILTSCPNFNSLNDIKKLEWICNCENHNILTYLGVFLRKHYR